jgi:hypothetical protein
MSRSAAKLRQGLLVTRGLGQDEQEDLFYSERSLIKQIMTHPDKEIATHTFSHCYRLESKHNLEAFHPTLQARARRQGHLGITLNSIVFPTNQYDDHHLELCRMTGLKAFRGVPNSWLFA